MQPVEERAGQLGADGVMTQEMAVSEGGWLADVVE
jgi:hypothetical protein